ncbi:MAG TPA: nucleotide exchange factor GrpE [Chthoniobacterales bacterium]|nr:nucleotide exchange factor GrpE [Chthoniobacterales bacterium]
MAKGNIELPSEFASAMQQLSAEAAKAIAPDLLHGADEESVPAAEIRQEFAALNERMAGMEKVLTQGLDRVAAASSPSAESSQIPAQLKKIDEHLAALRNTESVNHRLFNTLHQELKSYRDNFLRDTLQKPFIRDLIVLFDDLSSLGSQMQSAASGADAKQSVVTQWSANLENAIHALLEVMHRMEVTEVETRDTVDRALHKVVSYEPTDFAEEDGQIVMRVRRGFVWRDQVLRPEEVVAKRFN